MDVDQAGQAQLAPEPRDVGVVDGGEHHGPTLFPAPRGGHDPGVTEEPAPIPLRDELTARERYALVFHGLLVLGSVPDTAVALVRWARRDRGVQLGPTLVTLLVSAPSPASAARRCGPRDGAGSPPG